MLVLLVPTVGSPLVVKSKTPTCLHAPLAQQNKERTRAGCVTINEKLTLKAADPRLAFPKHARSHLLLSYGILLGVSQFKDLREASQDFDQHKILSKSQQN